MWEICILGEDVYHILNWFILYSFLGWVWETGYVSIRKGKFVNRGFINGPFCTIYGCGAVAVYLILKPVEQNLFFLYVGGVVVATALEYVTAVLMESIFHTSWWDYSDQKFNFQGRICLGVSLGWGVFAVALFRIIHPVVSSLVSLYPSWVGKTGVVMFLGGYVIDFVYSAAAAFHLHERIPAWEQMLDELQSEFLLNASEKMRIWAESRGVTRDHLKNRLEDIELIKEMDAKRIAVRAELSRELELRKEAVSKRFGHNIHRFVRSYPNLNRGYRIHKERKNKKHSNE